MFVLPLCVVFFFQAEDGIRDDLVTGVQTCALPISEPNTVSRTARMTRLRSCMFCLPGFMNSSRPRVPRDGIRFWSADIGVPRRWVGRADPHFQHCLDRDRKSVV